MKHTGMYQDADGSKGYFCDVCGVRWGEGEYRPCECAAVRARPKERGEAWEAYGAAATDLADRIDRLTASLRALNDELARLGNHEHGGVTYSQVGSLVNAQIRPVGRKAKGVRP